MKKKFWIILTVAVFAILLLATQACMESAPREEPVSTSGVEKATAEVTVQASGLTVEQENIKFRIEAENVPGEIKHLYIISAYSGQVIMYSTVKGKVTSSGKRLTPYTVAAMDGEYVRDQHEGIPVRFPDGNVRMTGEVLQDDGTYGHSIPYLFWWDVKGIYHQHYVSGGQIIHVSDQPIPGVKAVILNID